MVESLERHRRGAKDVAAAAAAAAAMGNTRR